MAAGMRPGLQGPLGAAAAAAGGGKVGEGAKAEPKQEAPAADRGPGPDRREGPAGGRYGGRDEEYERERWERERWYDSRGRPPPYGRDGPPPFMLREGRGPPDFRWAGMQGCWQAFLAGRRAARALLCAWRQCAAGHATAEPCPECRRPTWRLHQPRTLSVGTARRLALTAGAPAGRRTSGRGPGGATSEALPGAHCTQRAGWLGHWFLCASGWLWHWFLPQCGWSRRAPGGRPAAARLRLACC